MKKYFLIFTVIFGIAKSYSQNYENVLPRLEKDTLFTKSGYNIVIGQDINIGTGSTPDGDFKFIRRNSTGFGTMMIMTDNNSYNKSQLSLPRSFSGHKSSVVKIATRGNKKIGITYEPLISINGVRYEIDVDNAITSGEIIVPDEFKPKSNNNTTTIIQQQSIADELAKLKKMYSDSLITKEEYEAAKKKLLGL